VTSITNADRFRIGWQCKLVTGTRVAEDVPTVSAVMLRTERENEHSCIKTEHREEIEPLEATDTLLRLPQSQPSQQHCPGRSWPPAGRGSRAARGRRSHCTAPSGPAPAARPRLCAGDMIGCRGARGPAPARRAVPAGGQDSTRPVLLQPPCTPNHSAGEHGPRQLPTKERAQAEEHYCPSSVSLPQPAMQQHNFCFVTEKKKKISTEQHYLPPRDREFLFTLLAVCCLIILQPGVTLGNWNGNLTVDTSKLIK